VLPTWDEKMKVCHLSSHHASRSVRIFLKQCRSLREHGFQVSYAVPGAVDETVDGVDILAVPKTRGVLGRLFSNPFRVFRRGLKADADLYHFHDPELIHYGVLFRLLGKKVIYDVHEDLPSRIREMEWTRSATIRFAASRLVRMYEKGASAFFACNITVNESIASRFSPAKTVIVTNLPIVRMIDEQSAFEGARSKPIIVYAGLLSRIRGIRELVDAMAHVGDRAELWLFGDWHEQRLFEECRQSPGWRHTRYHGRVSHGEVYSYIKAADIGVVNFLPAHNHLFAMPNKAFEYITCSKPMVMSRFPSWKEKFANCALFVDPQDPRDIADKLLQLLNDPELGRELGRKGRELILDEFSWESESRKLIKVYEDVLTS
jgi:glycosyltransferase involved in cell wall biosynthesis